MNIKIDVLFNYVLPIFILLMIYLIYKYYVKFYYRIREKFTNKYDAKLCDDNSCGLGCKKPTNIDDTCPTTIYKDVDGNCHKKCPYVCANKNKEGCKYDECCAGCGYTKIKVPCDLANKPYKKDKKYDKNDNESESESEYDGPAPNKDKKTKMKSNNLDNNMTDVNKQDDFYKGWSPFVKKWPCEMNVTGTFTECGPNAYNSCN
jgi:hypothetical protein